MAPVLTTRSTPTPMGEIEQALHLTADKILSDQNYEESFSFYRFWFDTGVAYGQISPHPIFYTIWNRKSTGSIDPRSGKLIHPTAHSILRFVTDAESDQIFAPHVSGLRSRLCTSTLQEFFNTNLEGVRGREGNMTWSGETNFYTGVNLVALWANVGCVEEAVIRNRILQSLISHPKLYDHQADALIILFKLAGATFEVYADPSVVDRCFERLKGHYGHDTVKGKLVQEVVELREHNWEGLPPPPVFTAGEPKQAGVNQNDPAATPVATSLGLPNRDIEPPQPPPPEPITTPETDTVPRSPVAHSPSISISALSDFTIADTSDDESPIDPTAITLHDTFYLDDGSIEVLCGNTLFRVHASALSFHSAVLGQMFAKSKLATAESPNGCPRIVSSDTATDFATLLKVIYLPEFPEWNEAPDFSTFSSLLRITAKYQMPTVRSRVLKVIRDAYPVTFEGLDPSKALGENVFSRPTPHPNAVLNLFVQQNLTSALPMAYYMAVRRGPGSLLDDRLPASARLPPKILQAAITGLFVLRGMELKETRRLIFGPKGSRYCSRPNCPSCYPPGQGFSEAHHKIADRIADSVELHSGTKLLQVLSLREICGDDGLGFCEGCVKAWEAGHADVRKKAWAALPDVFGLKV